MGDYELITELGRGGMGLVYRARQISLNRMVAVKVLLAGPFADEQFIQRFRREAEAAASLNHRNIISIHDIGEHEGRPYFSMELIEGRSLAEFVRDKPLPGGQAAQLLQTVADAVHFAHERGVLHRDLKPSNVLIDSNDVPHITDFGLAKRFDRQDGGGGFGGLGTSEPADLTLTGQVLGSPNYMPPEQANPAVGPTTAASDVYALGAILYHLLTGRPPHLAESMAQTLHLVVEGDPVPPRLLNPALSRDLETICLKCLEKDPGRRYGSAKELADELRRFMRDEPICARPISRIGRLKRWCRRKPALATSLAAGVFLLLVVLIGSPIAMVRINAERKRAETARQQESTLRVRAEVAERETSRQLYTALLEQARATVRSGEMGHRVRALSAIRRAAAISNNVELRREVFAALALGDLEFERELPFPATSFNLRELDPNFERIAVSQGTQAVEVISLDDRRVLATLPATSTNRGVHVAEWSRDGRYLAVKRDLDGVGFRADLDVWDLSQNQRILDRRTVLWGAMCFHPTNPWWMVGGEENVLTLIDLKSGGELRRFQLRGKIQSFQFSPDGGRFAAVHGGADRFWNVSVFDATNGTRLAFQVFPLVQVAPLRWHPNGRWLVIPLGNGAVKWMDAATGELGDVGSHKAEASVAVFSPDGDYLLTSGWDRELQCFDGHTRRRLFDIREDSYVARFRSDGGAAALLTDTGVRLYKVARQSGHREMTGQLGARLRHAAFSPDGQWLAVSSDKSTAVWNLNTASPAATCEEAYEAHFFFSDDSRELFASRNNPSRISAAFRWQLQPPTNDVSPPLLLARPIATVPDFTFLSARSNRVILTSGRGSQVLSADQPEKVSAQWKETIAGVTGISPDARWLAIRRPYSVSVYIYGVPDLQRVAKLEHGTAIGNFAFDPGGTELLICSKRGLDSWSTSTWQRNQILTNLAASGVFYQPDGRAVWLRRYEESGLYDRRTLQPKLLLSHEMTPWAVSSDGRLLAVGIDGRRLQIWNLEELRAVFRELNVDWADE